MTMDHAISLLTTGLMLWLLGMAAVIAWGMLRRNIRITGILTDRLENGGRAVNMHRLQLLVVFLFVLAAYAKSVLDAMGGPNPITEMPAPPDMLAEVLLASKGVYLGGKIANRM